MRIIVKEILTIPNLLERNVVLTVDWA